MIDKQYLINLEKTKPITGILNIGSQSQITSGDCTIEKHPRMNLTLLKKSGVILGTDQAAYITGHNPEILDLDFDSILIGGLGLGIIPYVVQDFCSVVDVVEIDPDVISCTNQFGHLTSSVNVILDDIETYTPTRTYDVIVLDVWYGEIPEELTDFLIEKYTNHLNDGGFLYIPINSEFRENKVKIYKS